VAWLKEQAMLWNAPAIKGLPSGDAGNPQK